MPTWNSLFKVGQCPLSLSLSSSVTLFSPPLFLPGAVPNVILHPERFSTKGEGGEKKKNGDEAPEL